MSMSHVSVVIPTFNRSKRLESTVKSLLKQSYDLLEIIIVDDGSNDDTKDIAKDLAKNSSNRPIKICYVWQPNQGACVARNRGMMLATGRYLLFLDSDDLIKPDMLSVMVGRMESTGCQCVICDFETVDDNGKVIGYFKNDKRPLDFIRTLSSSHVSTVLIRRDSIPPGLQWNAALKRIQDVDFTYKYFFSVTSWEYIGQPLFQYVLHEGERISGTYSMGVQYGELRRSLKSYLLANQAFIVDDWRDHYQAYSRQLLTHQLRNTLAAITPGWLKTLRKTALNKLAGTD